MRGRALTMISVAALVGVGAASESHGQSTSKPRSSCGGSIDGLRTASVADVFGKMLEASRRNPLTAASGTSQICQAGAAGCEVTVKVTEIADCQDPSKTFCIATADNVSVDSASNPGPFGKKTDITYKIDPATNAKFEFADSGMAIVKVSTSKPGSVKVKSRQSRETVLEQHYRRDGKGWDASVFPTVYLKDASGEFIQLCIARDPKITNN